MIRVAGPKCGEEAIMSEPEEEDLTKFDLDDLIEIANKITEQMVREKATQASAERLFKISAELLNRVSGHLQEASSRVGRRLVRPTVAVRSIGKEIPRSRTKGLPHSGGGR
jgi:glycine cleavage system protein P-like pyridoxal-binding family